MTIRTLHETLYEVGYFIAAHILLILIVPAGILVSVIIRALHTEGEQL